MVVEVEYPQPYIIDKIKDIKCVIMDNKPYYGDPAGSIKIFIAKTKRGYAVWIEECMYVNPHGAILAEFVPIIAWFRIKTYDELKDILLKAIENAWGKIINDEYRKEYLKMNVDEFVEKIVTALKEDKIHEIDGLTLYERCWYGVSPGCFAIYAVSAKSS